MKKIGLFVLLLTSVGFQGCKKEQGCMRNNALNFDQEAEEDDGSCMYEGSFYTYISSFDKNKLLTDGIDAIEVYMDNSYVGLINVASYSTGSKTCTSPNVAAKKTSWVGTDNKTYTIDYRDQATGFSIESAVVIVYPGNCNYATLDY